MYLVLPVYRYMSCGGDGELVRLTVGGFSVRGDKVPLIHCLAVRLCFAWLRNGRSPCGLRRAAGRRKQAGKAYETRS